VATNFETAVSDLEEEDMSSKTILEVREEVEFHYPEDARCIYSIPAGLKLSLGEAWCLHGISGSGKSTLMTLLASLRRLKRGTIRYWFDLSRVEVAPEVWDLAVGPCLWRRIGFAFQRPELIRALSVQDNLRLALGSMDISQPPLFGEEEWRRVSNSPVWEISGGQVQRLGLLRAFGLGQNLVFLDEPTNNLDRRNRRAVAEFVRVHRETHALVVVSHDEDFIQSLEIDRMFDIAESVSEDGGIRRSLRATGTGTSGEITTSDRFKPSASLESLDRDFLLEAF
jgi:ABC-type lipoprotein export system ATPase subunit